MGDRLGQFKLVELLGEGGAGTVFRGMHVLLEREVALKVLHPEIYVRPDMVARFFREALAVNRARHPNIIDITDVVSSDNHPPFIVMEMLRGRDLATFIEDDCPCPEATVIGLMTQVCAALSTVHGLGIVHRDLKPENIFLVDNGTAIPTVKLLDFGIAKFQSADERTKTRTGVVLGTLEYMPLEQLHGFDVDQRTDIYALGVVMYELLTARLPFQIGGAQDLMPSRMQLEAPPPSERLDDGDPRISPALDALVLRCLADDPDRRVQSADELGQLLAHVAGHPDDVATVERVTPAPLETTPAPAASPEELSHPSIGEDTLEPETTAVTSRQRLRRWGAIAAAISGVVAIGIAVVLLATRGDRSSKPKKPVPRATEGAVSAPMSTSALRTAEANPGTTSPDMTAPASTAPPKLGAPMAGVTTMKSPTPRPRVMHHPMAKTGMTARKIRRRRPRPRAAPARRPPRVSRSGLIEPMFE